MEDDSKSIEVEHFLEKSSGAASKKGSPPRSSDSDWSDIDTDEQTNETDEEAADRLRIDTQPHTENNSLECTNESETGSKSPSNIKQDRFDKNVENDCGESNSKTGQNSTVRYRNEAKMCNYKRKIRYGGSTDVPNEILDAVAGAKGDNFNLRLDKAAKRMRLNRTQVKSVLRKLVESPDLLNYAMEKAGDKPESQVEPRITRELAKQVVNSGGKLNWFLEKVAQTPQKASAESLALMTDDFPEDEPEDVPYDPSEDMKALKAAGANAWLEIAKNDDSDEENFIPSDADCTPGGTSSLGGDDSLLHKTPVSGGLFSSDTPPLFRPEENEIEYKLKEQHCFEFKHPSQPSRESQPGFYNQNLDGNRTSAIRSLDFDQQSVTHGPPDLHINYHELGIEVSNSGKSPIRPSNNTRSKASLKDVSIDELAPLFLDPFEANLPPDLTFCQYEAQTDENEMLFHEFLKDLSKSGAKEEKNCENEESLRGEENDPDYEFNQQEEHPPDEYRYNRSTKIPQKEVDALMQELLEDYSLNKEQEPALTEITGFSSPGKSKMDEESVGNPQETEASSNASKMAMTYDQHAMIGQQMRQHIQLLTQMTLLTSFDPMWQTLNGHCKEMTNELFSKSLIIKSTNHQQMSTSMFAQDNLFPSLGLVQEWEKLSSSPTEILKTAKGEKYNVSPKLMEFMANKPGAFLYPQLLPHSAINPAEDKMVFWSSGEDELIALKLEEYEKSNPSSKKSQASCLKTIHKHLIRNKTVPQIRSRYKNQTKKILVEKGKNDVNLSGSGPMNAILYYKEHQIAPRVTEFYQRIPYEADAWRKLKDMRPTYVPPVWRKYMQRLKGEDATEGVTEVSDVHSVQERSNTGINHIEANTIAPTNTMANIVCDISSTKTYSMPQIGSSAMTKSLQNSSKNILSQPKLRYIPIVPKESPPKDTLNSLRATSEMGLRLSSENTTVANGNHEKATNIQTISRKEAEKGRKKSIKSNKNVIAHTMRNEAVQRQNINHDKPSSPIKILPKDGASATTQYRLPQEKAQSDCEETEDAPQISILDEAMEVCGILNENSSSEVIMVDGVIPIKGSDLKDAMQITMNSSNLQIYKAPSSNADAESTLLNQGLRSDLNESYLKEVPCNNGNKNEDSRSIDGGQVQNNATEEEKTICVKQVSADVNKISLEAKLNAVSISPTSNNQQTSNVTVLPVQNRNNSHAIVAENILNLHEVVNLEEAPAQMTSSYTNRQQTNEQYESVFEIQTEAPNEEAVRREHEAMEIVLQAQAILKGDGKLESFFQIIQNCIDTPAQAFVQLHNLCQGLPELQELLLDLLTSEQALEISPMIYAQHCLRNDMKNFCQKVKNVYLGNSANQGGQAQATKIFKELHNFISQDNQEHTSDDLRNFASKLFKGNQQLIDTFVSFLPGQMEHREKIWNCIDPEIIDLSDEENEPSNGPSQAENDQFKGYEHIKDIPETEEEKLFGTEQCPCQCHPRSQSITSHCIHCSIRFINGKIYAREGKVLKPVRVKYPAGKNPFKPNENSLPTNSVNTQVFPTFQSTSITKK